MHHIEAEPVEQVPAKQPLVCQGGQIGVGGRDQSDIHSQRFLAANPLKLTVFNHPEQFFLQSQ